MKLDILGSGSKGNCYLFHNEDEALMIEAGVPFEKVLTLLEGEIGKLNGCIVTHEHKDHAGYVQDVLKYAVPVYATRGTIKAIGKVRTATKPVPFEEIPRCLFGIKECRWNPFMVGNFTIIPFVTIHDASEPCGFYINHPDTGAFLFATDTAYIPNTFGDLRNVLIECNYKEQLLKEREDIPNSLKKRIRDSHMSVDTCINALLANDLSKTNNIILIHISEGDGDPEDFWEKVSRKVSANVVVARPGLTMNFNKEPF